MGDTAVRALRALALGFVTLAVSAQALAGKDIAECETAKAQLVAQYALIKGMPDAEFASHTGLTRLEYTAMLGTDQQMKDGLSAMPPDTQPRMKQLLLFSSAWYGRLENVQYLVGQGADVNYTHGTMSTPLVVAAQCGGPQVARFLIANHANLYTRLPNMPDAMVAALSSNGNETIAVLFDAGYDPCLVVQQAGKPSTAEVATRLGHPEVASRLNCVR